MKPNPDKSNRKKTRKIQPKTLHPGIPQEVIKDEMRINRALALAGFGSRRKAEELVKEGRVKINGKVVTELSVQVDVNRDKIEVDSKSIRTMELAYYALYKPRDVVTTMSDERGRECVADLIKTLGVKEKVKPVGRLDRRSEGLLILTNDGALAAKLTHPSIGVKKHYQVSMDRFIKDADIEAFSSGIELSDGLARFDSIELYREHPSSVSYLIVVSEGRNRLIRRLLGAREYKVKRLVRVEMGGVRLSGLHAGQIRKLTNEEIKTLKLFC
jgi:23S rRNA pseudouridine2605 synthase